MAEKFSPGEGAWRPDGRPAIRNKVDEDPSKVKVGAGSIKTSGDEAVKAARSAETGMHTE